MINTNLENIRHITIVGGGFSGASILAQQVREVKKLIENGEITTPVKITIVDPSQSIGPGHPYNPPLDSYLLNQPAYAMSPFPDEPNHFVNWLGGNTPEMANSFQRRKVYGQYLEEIFNDAVKTAKDKNFPVEIEWRQTTVTQANFDNSEYVVVKAEDGSEWKSDCVIVADGHHQNELLSKLKPELQYFDTVLDCERFTELKKPHNKILIVGSGQDMMDRLSDLHHCGYNGIIDIVSRNGVLPWVFKPSLYAPDRDIPPYRLAHFTSNAVLAQRDFEGLNALWNKELLHAIDTGYGYGHVLGAFYNDDALQNLKPFHDNPGAWQKQIDYISAFYGNPTPKERHKLLEPLIQSDHLHQIFSSVSENQVKQNDDGTFEVNFADGRIEKYDAIINSASCARSLITRQGNIRSPLIASFNDKGLIKWDQNNDGIIVAGQQIDSRLFYAGPYSYPGKWGVETYRVGHQKIAQQSLQAA